MIAEAPPTCNTGVYPPPPYLQPPGLAGRFDWYRASVPAHPELVLGGLLEAVERDMGSQAVVTAGHPRWSFLRASTVSDSNGHRIAEVLHGGRNPHPCVEASGEYAPFVADVLRAHGPHRVSRVDVAVDRAGPSLFMDLRALCERLSTRYGLQLRVIEAPTDPDAGRTVYLGSRKSEVFLRVYEKGLQVARLQGLAKPIPDDFRHWVRAELEFKPHHRSAKKVVATMDPKDLWGVSEWLADFAKEAFAMDCKTVSLRERRESDFDRAMRWMVHQYSAHLDKLADQCGGDPAAAWEALMAYRQNDQRAAA